jgi:peptidylprolyl isomerase
MTKKIGLFLFFLFGVVCIFTGIHIDRVIKQKDEYFFEEGEKAIFSEYLGYVLWKNLSRYFYYDFNKVLKTLVALENGKLHSEDCQKDSTILIKLLEKAEAERSNHNLVEAESFLAHLKKNTKIVELKEGKIFYEVLKEGSGSPICENDFVYVHFREMDINQNIYRDTTETSVPVKIKLSEAIPGLRYATMGMLVGEKRKIYIHPVYGYGTIGKTEPNQVSIFEIEIFSK